MSYLQLSKEGKIFIDTMENKSREDFERVIKHLCPSHQIIKNLPHNGRYYRIASLYSDMVILAINKLDAEDKRVQLFTLVEELDALEAKAKPVINVPEGFEVEEKDGVFNVVQKKEEPELPKRWGDLGEIRGYWVVGDSSVNSLSRRSVEKGHKNVFLRKEQAEASIALAQLTQLYDRWKGEPVPAGSTIYSPTYTRHPSRIQVKAWDNTPAPFGFPDKVRCSEFIDTFRDLLEQAAPLLWGVNLKKN